MSNSFAKVQVIFETIGFNFAKENNEKEWRYEFASILVEIEENFMWIRYLGSRGIYWEGKIGSFNS